MIVIVLEPTGALAPTFTVRVAGADPPDGILSGLGENVENVTPDGTEPVIDRVTAPEKPRILVPVTVIIPEPPWASDTVPGAAPRLKSG